MTHHQIIAAALRTILRNHKRYGVVDTQGRANIRRNINETLYAQYAGHRTSAELVADYRANERKYA